MNPITEEILTEIGHRRNPGRAEFLRGYFKEEINTYGLTLIECGEVAKAFYPKVKGDLSLLLIVGGELHSAGIVEADAVGDILVKRMKAKLTPEHFRVFDTWVDTLNNWASTDSLSSGLISVTVKKDPSLVEELVMWTASPNRWRRRAAAVSLVPIARREGMLPGVIRVADRLMEDRDDMAQKGVGWLLKEASKVHPNEVRDYLIRWKPKTTGLVLRYASEKLPPEMRVNKRS